MNWNWLERFQARDRSQRKVTAKPVIYEVNTSLIELLRPHQVDAAVFLALKNKGVATVKPLGPTNPGTLSDKPTGIYWPPGTGKTVVEDKE